MRLHLCAPLSLSLSPSPCPSPSRSRSRSRSRPRTLLGEVAEVSVEALGSRRGRREAAAGRGGRRGVHEVEEVVLARATEGHRGPAGRL